MTQRLKKSEATERSWRKLDITQICCYRVQESRGNVFTSLTQRKNKQMCHYSTSVDILWCGGGGTLCCTIRWYCQHCFSNSILMPRYRDVRNVNKWIAPSANQSTVHDTPDPRGAATLSVNRATSSTLSRSRWFRMLSCVSEDQTALVPLRKSTLSRAHAQTLPLKCLTLCTLQTGVRLPLPLCSRALCHLAYFWLPV